VRGPNFGTRRKRDSNYLWGGKSSFTVTNQREKGVGLCRNAFDLRRIVCKGKAREEEGSIASGGSEVLKKGETKYRLMLNKEEKRTPSIFL